VQLSTKAHPQTVKVTFNTQPVPKMIKDYSGPASTVLTFDPGVDQQFVEIQLLGKVKPVGTEKVVIFTDSLSDPVNCTIDVGAANCSVMQ
jgi:hypothetical protein